MGLCLSVCIGHAKSNLPIVCAQSVCGVANFSGAICLTFGFTENKLDSFYLQVDFLKKTPDIQSHINQVVGKREHSISGWAGPGRFCPAATTVGQDPAYITHPNP